MCSQKSQLERSTIEHEEKTNWTHEENINLFFPTLLDSWEVNPFLIDIRNHFVLWDKMYPLNMSMSLGEQLCYNLIKNLMERKERKFSILKEVGNKTFHAEFLTLISTYLLTIHIFMYTSVILQLPDHSRFHKMSLNSVCLQ